MTADSAVVLTLFGWRSQTQTPARPPRGIAIPRVIPVSIHSTTIAQNDGTLWSRRARIVCHRLAPIKGMNSVSVVRYPYIAIHDGSQARRTQPTSASVRDARVSRKKRYQKTEVAAESAP